MKKFKEWLGEKDVIAEKDWIQGAVDPKHKGFCTPITKKTCTPHRKALAKRFKHGDIHNDNEKKDEAFQSKHWILNKLNQQHAAGVQSVKQAIEQIKQITNQVDPEGMNGFAYKEWQNFLGALSRIESVMVAAGDKYA